MKISNVGQVAILARIICTGLRVRKQSVSLLLSASLCISSIASAQVTQDETSNSPAEQVSGKNNQAESRLIEKVSEGQNAAVSKDVMPHAKQIKLKKVVAPVQHGTEEVEDSWAQIRKARVIRLGYRSDRVPFAYLSQQTRQPEGYSVELCEQVVKSLRNDSSSALRIVWVPIDSKTRFSFLEEHKIDMACGNDTNTRERQKKYAFSHTLFLAGVRVIAKKSEHIADWEDLRGRRIAVVANTTGEALVKDLNSRIEPPAQIVGVQSLAYAWELLTKGHVAALAYDDVLLHELQMRTPGNKGEFEFVGGYLSIEPYGIMMRKEDSVLLKHVNAGLSKVFESGKIYPIYEQWFMNDERNIPMSKLLKESIVRPNAYPAYP